MGGGPGALFRVEVVDERCVQLGRTQDAGQQALFLFGLRLRRHGDGVALGGQADVRPDGGQAGAQLVRGQLFDFLEGVHFQIHQQRVPGGNRQFFSVQLLKHHGKLSEIAAEAAALVVRPYLVGRKAQSGLKLGVTAPLGEGDQVGSADLEKVHELKIDLIFQVVRLLRDNARHDAGNAGGVVAFEHAHPLVPFLNIKLAQVFQAGDGVGDAGFAQMRLAQVDPFAAKLGRFIQQRHKIPGESGLAPIRPSAHDAVHGNVHQADFHRVAADTVVDQFVQYQGIGVFTLRHAGVIIFSSLPQSSHKLLQGFRSVVHIASDVRG